MNSEEREEDERGRTGILIDCRLALNTMTRYQRQSGQTIRRQEFCDHEASGKLLKRCWAIVSSGQRKSKKNRFSREKCAGGSCTLREGPRQGRHSLDRHEETAQRGSRQRCALRQGGSGKGQALQARETPRGQSEDRRALQAHAREGRFPPRMYFNIYHIIF